MDKVFRTDRSSRAILGVVFPGFGAFSLFAAIESEVLLGLIVAAICVAIWLYYATITVTVAPNLVQVRRFWRPIWQSPRNDASAIRAKGGDFGMHACLRLMSSKDVKTFDMLQSLFGKAAIEEAYEMIGKPK